MSNDELTSSSADAAPPASSPTPIVYVKARVVWQYRHVVRDLTLDDALSDEELDALGVEGWELVSVVVYDGHMYWYFKRMAD
jgi:hypothetical protein